MHPRMKSLAHITRRHFLKDSSLGIGAMALGSLLQATLLPRRRGWSIRWRRRSRTFRPRPNGSSICT